MAWEDVNLKLQVFDPRLVGQNLLDWFAENQDAALYWANNNVAIPATKHPKIQDFFPNARRATRFPVCMINRAKFQTTTGEDIAETQIVIEYEIALVNGKEDWLAKYAPVYEMAFASMAKNVPKSRLELGSKIEFDGVLLQLETTFDYLGQLKSGGFIQVFTTSVNWLCGFSNE